MEQKTRNMVARPARLIGAIVIGLVLASLAALQSASSVLTRPQPAMAVRLLPINGPAWEQLANQQFVAGVASQDDILPSAKHAAPTAMRAFKYEPLTSKAHAIVAIAQGNQGDGAGRRALLDAAIRLDRRDLLLQGQNLEDRIARKDYAGALDAMDIILRVHSAQHATFFKILTQVLTQDAALPEMARILEGDARWHQAFIGYASRDRAALPNLSKLRLQRQQTNPEIDRNLISGLSAMGEMEQAYRIYNVATGTGAQSAAGGSIDWSSKFPPFDWQLEDQPGFRAQPSRSGKQLEIFVRSGKGGLIAQRTLPVPAGNISLILTHNVVPANQVKNVRITVGCTGSDAPFFDQALSPGKNHFRLGKVGARCQFINLVIHARAWSGRPNLEGTIDPLQISAR